MVPAAPAPKRPPDNRLPRKDQELMAEMESLYHDVESLLKAAWGLFDRRKEPREEDDGL